MKDIIVGLIGMVCLLRALTTGDLIWSCIGLGFILLAFDDVKKKGR